MQILTEVALSLHNLTEEQMLENWILILVKVSLKINSNSWLVYAIHN